MPLTRCAAVYFYIEKFFNFIKNAIFTLLIFDITYSFKTLFSCKLRLVGAEYLLSTGNKRQNFQLCATNFTQGSSTGGYKPPPDKKSKK